MCDVNGEPKMDEERGEGKGLKKVGGRVIIRTWAGGDAGCGLPKSRVQINLQGGWAMGESWIRAAHPANQGPPPGMIKNDLSVVIYNTTRDYMA